MLETFSSLRGQIYKVPHSGQGLTLIPFVMVISLPCNQQLYSIPSFTFSVFFSNTLALQPFSPYYSYYIFAFPTSLQSEHFVSTTHYTFLFSLHITLQPTTNNLALHMHYSHRQFHDIINMIKK